jgi:hypothetical protein
MSQNVPELNPGKSLPSTINWSIPTKSRKNCDSVSVTFNTEQDYNNALENPYPMAIEANRDDIKTIYLSVRGDRKPRIMLRVKSVLLLGHKTGVL